MQRVSGCEFGFMLATECSARAKWNCWVEFPKKVRSQEPLSRALQPMAAAN